MTFSLKSPIYSNPLAEFSGPQSAALFEGQLGSRLLRSRYRGNGFFTIVFPVDVQFFGSVENGDAVGRSVIPQVPFHDGFDLY